MFCKALCAVHPAVFGQAFRLWPAVRSRSAPECVRLYRFRRSGSGWLYALTVRRSASGCIGAGVPPLAGCRQLSPVIRSGCCWSRSVQLPPTKQVCFKVNCQPVKRVSLRFWSHFQTSGNNRPARKEKRKSGLKKSLRIILN